MLKTFLTLILMVAPLSFGEVWQHTNASVRQKDLPPKSLLLVDVSNGCNRRVFFTDRVALPENDRMHLGNLAASSVCSWGHECKRDDWSDVVLTPAELKRLVDLERVDGKTAITNAKTRPIDELLKDPKFRDWAGNELLGNIRVSPEDDRRMWKLLHRRFGLQSISENLSCD
jgi:hypothetical protein